MALLTGCGSNFEWLPDGNIAPIAKAGADQNGVALNTLITLDGSGSSDPNGNTLTYHWSLTTKPLGSAATLSSPTNVKPTFTPDTVGVYIFTLTVNDGKSNSLPSTVKVTTAPSANAGPPQTVITGTTVTLDGSASRVAAGSTQTYHWSFINFPTPKAPILTTTTDPAKPVFVPPVVGTYVVGLIVNDGSTDSPISTVTITVVNSVVNTGDIIITW